MGVTATVIDPSLPMLAAAPGRHGIRDPRGRGGSLREFGPMERPPIAISPRARQLLISG
jgi:hypothetical protein